MSGRRVPVAELGDEDYRIVRHTHDVELAERLMRQRLLNEYGCETWHPGGPGAPLIDHDCLAEVRVGTPRQRWVRIVPCLPGSSGDMDGWAFEYRHADGPGRGVFPAVVFE